MAQMMIPRIALLSIKNSNRLIPRIFVPLKYQRLCFHTSWVLDGMQFIQKYFINALIRDEIEVNLRSYISNNIYFK